MEDLNSNSLLHKLMSLTSKATANDKFLYLSVHRDMLLTWVDPLAENKFYWRRIFSLSVNHTIPVHHDQTKYILSYYYFLQEYLWKFHFFILFYFLKEWKLSLCIKKNLVDNREIRPWKPFSETQLKFIFASFSTRSLSRLFLMKSGSQPPWLHHVFPNHLSFNH